MTNEQAITVLNMIEAHGDLAIKAKELAIEALRKQIPQKADTKHQTWYGIITRLETFVCPNCKGSLYDEKRNVYHNYCPDCGQAIDWSDDE